MHVCQKILRNTEIQLCRPGDTSIYKIALYAACPLNHADIFGLSKQQDICQKPARYPGFP